MWSLRAQACVESRELACSVRLRRIGLAEPPFLVSASVALHALQEAFCRLVENWLKTVNYGSCGAQMNRLNCSFSVFLPSRHGSRILSHYAIRYCHPLKLLPPLVHHFRPQNLFLQMESKNVLPMSYTEFQPFSCWGTQEAAAFAASSSKHVDFLQSTHSKRAVGAANWLARIPSIAAIAQASTADMLLRFFFPFLIGPLLPWLLIPRHSKELLPRDSMDSRHL